MLVSGDDASSRTVGAMDGSSGTVETRHITEFCSRRIGLSRPWQLQSHRFGPLKGHGLRVASAYPGTGQGRARLARG
jgi:hypothetical protein